MQHRFTPSGHIPCWDAVQRFQLENFGLDSTRCQRPSDQEMACLKAGPGKALTRHATLHQVYSNGCSTGRNETNMFQRTLRV